MVAIFTGQGAGFERGSGASLGGVGLLGSSGLGRNGAQTFVNAANGNFLITRQDEFLVGLGPDSAISRTYNSQGALDENGDDWRQSTDRRVFGLIGTANTAGSSVKRVSADGSEITYSWNGSVYEALDGAGAYDQLSYSGGVWTWTDGDSQVEETYQAYGTDNWRIASKTDRDGNALSFTYNGDKLDRVTTANGEYTQYAWSGNNVTQITTHYTDLATSTSKTLTRTRYTYDASNRLKTVMVDLSPENNSLEDSNVYTTTYTYHGSSNRVATISQTDGSSLAITYDGSNRVQTLTQTVTSGESRVTGFAYYAGRTEITDPLGNTTKLYYDNQNQLIEIESPPAVTGAAAQSVQFAYDALGNVTSVTDAAGAVTEYRYDANGNVSYVRHPNGSTTLRTYDDENHVTQEITTGASITLPGTAANQAPVAATNSVTVTQTLGGDLNLDLAALFSDPGDTLTFTPTGLPSGVTFDGQYLTGTPSSTGTYTISVSASDGSLSASKSFTLTVTAASDLAPVAATSFDPVTQTEGGSLTLDLADLFVDPESQTLTYSATNIPAGMSLSGSVLSGIPTTAGTYTLTVSASDGANVTQKSVTITIEAPTGGTVDPTSLSLASLFENPSDGAISYGVSGYPSGLSVSGGVLSGTASAAGSYTITATATKTMTLTVTESTGTVTPPSIPSGMTPAVGTTGDDTGVDFAGNQAWDGVSGWDVLQLAGTASDYSFYTDSSGVGIIVNNSSGDIDTVENIDALYFAGDSSQIGVEYFFGVQTGTSAAETVVGTSNAELIEAGDGNDIIYGGLGDDYIDGGAGWDRINLLGAKSDYTFERHPDGKISIINTVTDEHDVVWNIEQFAWVNGPYGDQIGDLTITDVTYAAPALVPTGGGINPTSLDLAALFDTPSDGSITYDVSGYPSGLSVTNGVLSGTASAAGNYAITVTATKVSTLVVTASSSGSTSTPPSIPSGMTAVTGTTGSDALIDSSGNQAYDGNGGWDTVQFSGVASDYSFYTDSSGIGIVVHNATGDIDTIENFAALRFAGDSSQIGVEYFFGVQTGTSAAETVVGTSGAELLEAGDGNDVIYGGLGDDYIDGGAGWDRINLAGAKTDYTFERHPDGKISIINNVTGEHDVVWNIEQFAWVNGPYGDQIGDLTITDVTYAAPALVTSGPAPTAVTGFNNVTFGTIPTPGGNPDTVSFDTGAMTFPPVSAPGSAPVSAADVTSALAYANASNNRIIYDGEGHLRYQVSAEGHVTEYRYHTNGILLRTVEYADNTYTNGTAPPSEATMNAWRDGLADRSASKITRYWVDDRGNSKKTIRYGAALTDGTESTAEGNTDTRYTYDQAGQLLFRTVWGQVQESFLYDGMGRLTGSTDLNGGTTEIVFNDEIAFDEPATTTIVKTYLGHVTTSVYNKAGELISQTDSGSDANSIGMEGYLYDANGQLRRISTRYGRTSDEGVDRQFFLYDKMGRKVADIGHDGEVVEYRYDANGRVAATIRYTNNLNSSQVAALNNPDEMELSNIRPAAHSFDIWEWTVYDSAGRVIQTVDGDGSVTSYEYDFADRLIGTYNYYNKLSVSSYMNATSTGPGAALPSAHAKDTVSRTFYDRDGRVIGALNAEGYLSQIVYDGAGQKTSETVFADATAANLRASGTYSQLLGSVTQNTSEDITTRYIYDGQGLLRFTIDALGQVNENVYFEGTMSNAIGLVRRTIQHAASLGTLNDYSYASVKAAVAALGNTADNRSDRMVYNSRGQLDYQIDPEGSVTRYFYDSQGNTIRTIVYAVQYSDTSLPSVSTMDSWASANGSGRRTTRYIYSTGGHLLAEIDAEGYVTRNYYDAQGRLWNSERFSNRVSANASWTINDVDAADKGAGALTRYRYDRMGRLSYHYDPNGVGTYTAYYANGTKKGESVGYQQGDENLTIYEYDHAGRLKSRYDYISDLATGIYVTTSYAYDGLGNLLSVTDPRGNETSYTYDKLGRVLTQKDAENGTVSYEYDAFGNAVKVTDARGNKTYNYYDQAGRLRDSVDAENYLTRTSYTAFGEVEAVTRFYNKVSGTPTVNNHNEPATHALDATTQFEYDKLSRLTKTIDAEGAFERNWYDAFGLRYQSRNKLGGITTYEYDKLGRMVKETLPVAAYDMDGSIEAANIVNKYVYDSRGNRTQAIEAFGLSEQRTTTYAYDAAGRVTSIAGDSVQTVSSATGAVTSSAPTETFVYDRRGNVIEHTDASGQRTLSWYDRLDRLTDQLTQKSATKGALVQHTYDANGNITETRAYETLVTLPANATGTAPAGTGVSRVTTFTYDKLNRLETSTVPSIQTGVLNGTSYTVTTGSLTTSYKYDANGNVVKITDPNGGKTFTYYDKLGRKTEQVDQENYLTRWTYDSEGNVTQERRFAQKLDATPTIESRGTVNFNYPAGALSTALGQTYQDRVTDFTYDRMGRRETELRQNVIVSNGGGGYAVQDSVITYTYNGLGQVLTKTEAVDAGGAATNTYVYDGAGRLKKETRKSYTDFNDNSVTPTVDYYYDGLGNMVRNRARGATGAAQRVTQFEYVAGGQLKRSIDATGFSRYFYYDTAGRVRREEYDRETPTGTVLHEAVGTDYDEAGRVIAQGALKQSGSVWTRGGNDTDIDTAVMKYNAFDEITERGINNKYAEKFEYDKAGRLIRTNSGDGVWKHFLYDKNGNQTLAVTSDGTNLNGASYNTIGEIITAFGGASGLGTAYVDGIVTTITAYDNRGLATSVREPQRQLSATGTRQTLVTRRSYNAFGEVIAETDAKNKTIDYAYNTMGRRIRTESPTVSITNEDGSTQNVRPTEKYYYDVSGRLVASRDANNNLTRLELLAGTGFGGTEALVTKTTTADSAFTEVKYDIHGDARTMIDQLGRSTTQAYDKMGRVIQVNHAGGLIDYYKYDGLGQQIKHYNSQLGVNVAETTLYDRQGRIQQQIAMGGDVTSYSYAWSDALATGGMETFGGWTQVTTYANGRTLTEETDLFGHSLSKNDLGDHLYNYTYDAAGRLASSTGAGGVTNNYNKSSAETVTYTWLNTGKVSTVSKVGTSSTYLNGTNSYDLLTSYKYDKTGNLTFEELKDGGATLSSQSASYDALGRLLTWTNAASDATPYATSTFKYDANGNIRNRHLTYTSIKPDGDSGNQQTYDYWYLFDSLNRVVTQDGEFDDVSGQILRGYHGTDVVYDAAGQRQYTLRNKNITTGGGVPGGPGSPPLSGDDEIGDGSDPGSPGPGSEPTTENFVLLESYTYTDSGALETVSIKEGEHVASGTGVAPALQDAVLRARFQYDDMGRQEHQWDYKIDGSVPYPIVSFQRDAVYNDKGQLIKDTTVTLRNDALYKSETTLNYGAGANYALGAQVFTTTRNWQGNTENAATRTDYDYLWFDGAQQKHMVFDSDTGNAGNTVYSTNYGYDVSGASVWAHVWDGEPQLNLYTVNTNGQIIRREERDFANASTLETTGQNSAFYLFGGKQMGEIGTRDTGKDYQTSIAYRTENAPINPITREPYERRTNNFSQSLTPITSYDQGQAAGSYTVRAGDNLRSIAAAVWGDSSLWYKLAEANGLSGNTPLIEGTSLRLPAGVIRNTHNASTFQPYDPAEAVGNTSPTTPKPPKNNKCGVFGQVLLVVVAVAVAYVTAGAAAGIIGQAAGSGASLLGNAAAGLSALGEGATLAGVAGGAVSGFAAGAVGGAVGSITSQGIGVATGIQEKFSWTAVASSALGGGLGGAGNLGIDSNILRAGASNVISQSAAIALGPQSKFSWASVAAAGVGVGVGLATGGLNPFNPISITAQTIADAGTRSLIEGTDFGDNVLAALPNVLGARLGHSLARGVAHKVSSLGASRLRADAQGGLSARDVKRLVLSAIEQEKSGANGSIIKARLDGSNFKISPANPELANPDAPMHTEASNSDGSLALGILAGIRKASPIGILLWLSNKNAHMGGRVASSLDGDENVRFVRQVDETNGFVELRSGEDWIPIARGQLDELVFDDNTVTPGVDFQSGSDRWFVPLDGEEQRIFLNGEALGASRDVTFSQVLLHRLNEGSFGQATKTTREIRNTPGILIASEELPEINGKWLGSAAATVPPEIADALSGREFASMDKAREAFWREVAANPKYASQFSRSNLSNMRNGNAPRTKKDGYYHGPKETLKSYTIHHKTDIQFGGPVYDMSNWLIVTPKMHNEIHYRDQK